MQLNIVITLSFASGFFLSPWSGGLLFTVFYILLIEIIYSYVWGWGLWRLAVIFASLLGWLFGKILFAPLLNCIGVKQWIDGFIPEWCGFDYWKNKIKPQPIPLHEVIVDSPSIEETIFTTPYTSMIVNPI